MVFYFMLQIVEGKESENSSALHTHTYTHTHTHTHKHSRTKMKERQFYFFDVFKNSTCVYFPPYHLSAFERWLKPDPIYRACTILGELLPYLFFLLLLIVPYLVVFIRRLRKKPEVGREDEHAEAAKEAVEEGNQ